MFTMRNAMPIYISSPGISSMRM